MELPTEGERPTRTALQKALRALRAHSAYEYQDRFRPWPCSRLDAAEYFTRFWSRRLDEAEVEVRGYLEDLQRRGQVIAYADVCGRATAYSLGASINFTFSMTPAPLAAEKCANLSGDVLNVQDFRRFVSTIRSSGHRIAFATFEPVAGLVGYVIESRRMTPKDVSAFASVVYTRLRKNFLRFHEVMRDDGYILLGHPFRVLAPIGFTAALTSIARPLGYRVEALDVADGERWLLRRKVQFV